MKYYRVLIFINDELGFLIIGNNTTYEHGNYAKDTQTSKSEKNDKTYTFSIIQQNEL